jgi:hypothetical protein
MTLKSNDFKAHGHMGKGNFALKRKNLEEKQEKVTSVA